MSRFHAEVIPSGDVLELRDLGSRCGTRLDGRPVKRALIRSGAGIGVGPYRLRFDGSSFEARSDRGALHLDAEGLVVEAGDARIGVVHDAGPKRSRLARLRDRFPNAQAVVFGHSHLPLHEEQDGFQIFNPGSPTERRRAPAHTMGIARVEGGNVGFELIALG